MASILRVENKDGSISFQAQVRLRRGGKIVFNESRNFKVQGVGARAEALAKRLCEDWAEALTEKMQSDTELYKRKQRGVTVAKLIERYIAFVEQDKKIGDSKRSVLGILMRSNLGALALSDLNTAAVIGHCRDRRAQGAKPQTIIQDVIYLGGVLKCAKPYFNIVVDLEEFEQAKVQVRSLGLTSKSAERDRRLQPSELSAFLAAAQATAHKGFIPIADIVRFAIATGMRQGEIVGLRWADLNEKDRTILIRNRKDPQEKLGNNQTVPLLGESFSIVKSQERADERIFPYHADSVRARFERLCVLAGITDLTFHDLRHEGISRLFEQGYQIQEVALVSGHKSWKNLARYTQLRAVDLHREVAEPVVLSGRSDRR
ncbi:site-specific integrase [uncultured Deefgea sp.]|uniref:site-specific integrase n=1 Tax=uncultured Deefgea sp. TaxID=1304914 RepID=UPI002622B0B4|nr:site-specific integrase [uncultured Deefgea sp.]